ncbi:unnamed protein product, partial [Prunus brigantina]
MEEGSPGAPLQNHRLTKRVRASNDSEHDTDLVVEPISTPMMSSATGEGSDQVPLPDFGVASFRDKLMNKVNMNQNVGIDINSLDADYEDLNDADDVQKWSLKGEWKLIDLINDYFVVKFELEEDLNFVLTGGPWIIAGQYLVMQKWRSGFSPATAHVTRMAAWIRVSAIQLECFDVWSLKRIGNLLGKLLKIDSLTTSQNRGKFARLCVELDLTKPLDAFVQINQNWYNIEYEGLPDICYLCGMYGHKREHCSLKEQRVEALGEEHPVVGGQVNLGSGSMEPIQVDTDLDHSLRGPWMNVAPRRRPKTNDKSDGKRESGAKAKGSRFDALRMVSEKFGRDKGETSLEGNKTASNANDAAQVSFAYGNKIWTKSKNTKSGGTRHALNDISNKTAKDINAGEGSGLMASVPSPAKSGSSHGARTKIVDGKKVVAMTPIFEQLDNWGHGQHIQKDKGVYIFGHQPPNIEPLDVRIQKGPDPESVNANLLSDNDDRGNQVEKMDLSEGHMDSVDGQMARDTFSNVEGAACTKFKTNMLDMISTHRIDILFICEPRISGQRALKVIQTLGFNCFEVVDAIGFSGGLWLLWNDSKVTVEIVGTSDQSISACVSWPGQPPWMFTAIYASPNRVKREKLWEYLTFVAESHDLPWLLAGDFNDILSTDDKMGGASFGRSKGFKDWPILPKLISPNQVSFVPGRHITDNILIAQELMHNFKNSKGKKGFIAWKIDLSKAYDRLNWNFIEQVLMELRLPVDLVRLIKSCVTTVKYQICVNGELTSPFVPLNGIRQGDPLSPYLFVLCIEKLSHIIFDAVEKKKWRPVKSSQSGPAVSHLFFADDLILFAEASSNQARVMRSCLQLFCHASGQKVNFEKSAIYCSPNTCKDLAKEISYICGSPLTNDLGKYLGMPLLHSRVTKGTYESLVDKVKHRLASWKGKFLSLAGKATLIQAVTASIPIYAMQTTKLPVSVCDDLDKLNRNFFWGGGEKKQKIHLCQWDLVCRPKSKGGMGFKKTAAMNQAMLAKIGWRLHNKDEGLWAKIYGKKYLQGYTILDPSLRSKQGCSSTWRSILHGTALLSQGLAWRIGKGDSTLFWTDKWVTEAPLAQQEGVLQMTDLNCVVSDFSKNGWWDVNKLRYAL